MLQEEEDEEWCRVNATTVDHASALLCTALSTLAAFSLIITVGKS